MYKLVTIFGYLKKLVLLEGNIHSRLSPWIKVAGNTSLDIAN